MMSLISIIGGFNLITIEVLKKLLPNRSAFVMNYILAVTEAVGISAFMYFFYGINSKELIELAWAIFTGAMVATAAADASKAATGYIESKHTIR